MPVITYVPREGAPVRIEARTGHTVMEAAVDNDIQGMVAECGGACACATCHVYVDEGWLARLPPMNDMEDAMLDAAAERRPNSRLSCQIEVDEGLDGLVVTVADNAG